MAFYWLNKTLKMKKLNKNQLKKILSTAIFMAIGLLLFKYLPMYIYGSDILFDASQHVTLTIFVLYAIWHFVPKTKKWLLPFYIFSAAILVIISIQRIFIQAHNEAGILLGITISAISIFIVEKRN